MNIMDTSKPSDRGRLTYKVTYYEQGANDLQTRFVDADSVPDAAMRLEEHFEINCYTEAFPPRGLDPDGHPLPNKEFKTISIKQVGRTLGEDG